MRSGTLPPFMTINFIECPAYPALASVSVVKGVICINGGRFVKGCYNEEVKHAWLVGLCALFMALTAYRLVRSKV